MSRLDDLAMDIYNELQSAPAPVRRDDLMAAVGIGGIGLFHRAKGALQDMLGATDLVTLVGDPTRGQDGGWLYSLQGDPQHPIAVTYLITKTRNIYLRNRRAYMVQKALTAGINGNTTAGRYARRVLRSQYRTLEDIVDVLVELGSAPPAPLP